MANYTDGTSNPNIFQYLPLKEKVDSEKERNTWKNFKSVILSTFPQVGKIACFPLYQHSELTWCSLLETLATTMTAQKHFAARPTDIIIATFPKCGTTWTKALVFTIVNRHSGLQNCSSALNGLTPHQLVPYLDIDVYGHDKVLDVESYPSPRALSVHVPHQALPKSIIDSNARIIYVSRDPKDVFVSHWHFSNHILKKCAGEVPMEEALENWCSGFSGYGSYWDHVQGYWSSSSKNRTLFLKYDDMMEEPVKNLRMLADFVGQPFTVEEEKDGVPDEIIHLCSFSNLKNMAVNKLDQSYDKRDLFSRRNSSLFRKGKTGDFRNHLTPEMMKG